MPNEKLFTSAAALEHLQKEEAKIDGLYDDPKGFCTFGIGHLVNPGDKWSCFLLESASGSELWKTFVGKYKAGKTEKPYLQRSAAFHEKFDDLKALAVEAAKQRIGQKKFGREYAKLSKAEQDKATELAKAAVDEQARVLAKTVADMLKEDIKVFERTVRNKVTVTLTQDEFDALISFSFNRGPTGFSNSDVLKEINKGKYNTGDAKQRATAIAAIEAAFARVNTSQGVVLPGLTKRRKYESDLFLKASRAALAELQKTAKPTAVPSKP